ncbi:GNAT family N-acetyltransferase [Loktanella sp. S4079]|uniref:GNAT family N-acetyltransferase n=1 Tax=Loktanella sp. S4079 TaxID=579483 RepID=UPI0005FA50E9|nr:N-acetyltransferase [Loktanella sp. S4079]KJZ18290.1 hypothetical protein TW80_15285 [Loktanella sp. S4079]
MTLFQAPEFARDMKRGEELHVDALLQHVFGHTKEVKQVAALRKSKTIAGETVLPMDGQIVGYYALSYMRSPKGWLCLAPLAIHPDLPRGYAKRMLGVLSEWARITGTPVVALGEPDIYEQSGFVTFPDTQFTSPYPAENTRFAGLAQTPKELALTYPKAFADLHK